MSQRQKPQPCKIIQYCVKNLLSCAEFGTHTVGEERIAWRTQQVLLGPHRSGLNAVCGQSWHRRPCQHPTPSRTSAGSWPFVRKPTILNAVSFHVISLFIQGLLHLKKWFISFNCPPCIKPNGKFYQINEGGKLKEKKQAIHRSWSSSCLTKANTPITLFGNLQPGYQGTLCRLLQTYYFPFGSAFTSSPAPPKKLPLEHGDCLVGAGSFIHSGCPSSSLQAAHTGFERRPQDRLRDARGGRLPIRPQSP